MSNRPPVAPKLFDKPLQPYGDQVVVLYVIAVYTVVIFGVWHIPGARILINPLKLFTIGWHELCHIMAAVLTGGTILKITIDPSLGGATIVEGGYPFIILTSGYIGSSLFGGCFMLGGFDTLVAKIMSFILGLGLIMPLVLVRDKLTILLTVIYEALLIGFWWVDHANALRWYCLFIGVMNMLYVIWDIADDRFFRKANDSDCTQFNIMFPAISSHVWAFLWLMVQIGILIGFVLLGVAEFKRTTDEMYYEADRFLPT